MKVWIARFAFTLSGTLLITFFIPIALFSSPGETTADTALTTNVALLKEYPERLIIPSIGVDANIQDVGITRHGSMAVPDNYTDVGWFRYGTVPGKAGSAVIDGHVDNGYGLAAVFSRLHEMQLNDIITVETVKGTMLHFRVTMIQAYPFDDVPLASLYATETDSYLNLITCEGTWNPEKKMYDKRLVVYAHLVS